MKNLILFLFLLFFSSSVFASEVILEFSNGWVIKLDDTKFANYDYKGSGKKKFYHRNFAPTSFSGITHTKIEDLHKSSLDEWIILDGVFKHSLERYKNRGQLSVIGFSMVSRKLIKKQTTVFKKNTILFETKQKPFKEMTEFKQALISTLKKKNIYKEIQEIKYKNTPEKNKTLEKTTTLISISIDGVQVQP